MQPWLAVGGGVRITGSGAAWLPAHRTLVVADVHVGYELAARRRGGYLPTAESGEQVAARLLAMAVALDVSRIVVAGDLRHSTRDVDDREREELARFAATVRSAVQLDLIEGNHDRGGTLSGDPPRTSLTIGDVHVVHEPPAHRHDAAMVVSGHLHPRITLRDVTGASTRFPCALVSDHLVVLPAFSEWAGGVEASRLVRSLPPSRWRALPMVNGEIAEVGVVFEPPE